MNITSEETLQESSSKNRSERSSEIIKDNPANETKVFLWKVSIAKAYKKVYLFTDSQFTI